jgi:hypothetical protein
MDDKQLMIRAGARLMDAAGMLKMEAEEWRRRKSEPSKEWLRSSASDAKGWAERCERIAKTNMEAAHAMFDHAKLLAEATTDKAA